MNKHNLYDALQNAEFPEAGTLFTLHETYTKLISYSDTSEPTDGIINIRTDAGSESVYVAGTLSAKAISFDVAATTTALVISDVGATGEHFLDMVDAYLGLVIETGTYQSTASGGVTLASANNRPVSLLFDDAGAALGAADYRATLSRVLLTVDQTNAITLNAMRGHVKMLDTVDISSASSVVSPITGYFELTGTSARTLSGHVAAVRAAVEEGASGTTTIAASSVYSGFEATLNSTRTYTTTGKMAAYTANISGGTSKWPLGVYMPGAHITEAFRFGDFASTAAGSGVVLSATATTAAAVYGDDGGVALTASHTKVLRGRMLVATAISGGPAVSTGGIYGQCKVAANCNVEGFVNGMYGYFEASGSITLTNTTCCFSGVHARCDVPSGVTLAASSNAAALSLFGDFGGTITGNSYGIYMRAADNGDFDYFAEIPAEVTNAANGGGTDVYIDVTIAGVAARITAKYVS